MQKRRKVAHLGISNFYDAKVMKVFFPCKFFLTFAFQLMRSNASA